MCNHYRMKYDDAVIDFASRFALDDVFDPRALPSPVEPIVNETWPWKDNAALPVVYRIPEGNTLGFMRWGIVPNPKTPRKWVSNARNDTLQTSPLWRRYFPRWRCLVPADGFYEPAGPEGAKWEALFHLPDDRPFFFAGVWTQERTFAIVTCEPNPTLAALPHDRMPVILDDAGASAWLNAEADTPATDLLALCKPYAGELVRVDMPRPQPRPGKVTRADLANANGELPLG